MKRIYVAYFIIVTLLVFAWWAAGEVYNPRPTPTHAIPTHITATDAPAVTAIVPVTEIVVVTEAPRPTATATMIPIVIPPKPTITLVPAATQAPTATYHVQEIPLLIHDDCFTVRYNSFGIHDRLRLCSYTELYRIP